jgi:restriction endonuclease S subunit
VTWAEVKLGRVARFVSGVGFPHDLQGREAGVHPFLKVSDLANRQSGYWVTAAKNWVDHSTLAQVGGRLAPRGAVVFPKVGAAMLKNSRMILGRPCAMDNNLVAVVPNAGDSRYWLYALSAVDLGEIAAGGALPYVNEGQLRELRLPLPPLEEQHRIADFLDAETAHIDKLSALRQRQLVLLQEKSTRRVYDTVRGAGDTGDRRPSGLEWLGTVPARWRVAAVSHYFEVELGKMLNQERAHGDNLRPYLRVANVQWGEIDVSELAMMNFPPGEQKRYRLQAGDLLVNEGGSWPGRAAVWDGEIDEIYYQKALHRIRPRGADLTWWLYFCLVVAERMNVFKVQGNSSTMTHLTREQLRPQRFPFPAVNEQEQAVKYLRDAEAKDHAIRDLLSRQQATLAERRQALITAAVTGEFDVSAASGRGIEE